MIIDSVRQSIEIDKPFQLFLNEYFCINDKMTASTDFIGQCCGHVYVSKNNQNQIFQKFKTQLLSTKSSF